MVKYCPNCGEKVQENNIYCGNCGSKLDGNNNNSNLKLKQKQCLYCGSTIPFGFTQCPKCGNYIDSKTTPVVKYIFFFILMLLICSLFWRIIYIYGMYKSFLFIFLISIMGIIFGIYLLTRKNENIKTHGIIMIILSVFVLFLSLS